jgi:hypothetical protein
MRAASLGAVLVVGLGGCALLLDPEDVGYAWDSQLQESGVDADASEVRDADSLDEASEVDSGNLVRNSGFEQGTAFCAPDWVPSGDSASFSSTKHTGTRSCLLCWDGRATYFGLEQSVAEPFPAGTNLAFGGWIGAENDAVTVPQVLAKLEVSLADGGKPGWLTTYGIPDASAWAELESNVVLPAPVTGFTLSFQGYQPPDAGTVCFLLDDAFVIAQSQ